MLILFVYYLSSKIILILFVLSAPPVVENLLVRSISSSTLQFVWDPLTCNNSNGIFGYYSAVLRRQDNNEYVDRRTLYDINLSLVTFQALDPCTNYTIKVLAVNSNQRTNSGQLNALSAETKAKGKNIISWQAMKICFLLHL